jgi:hypothetical protein
LKDPDSAVPAAVALLDRGIGKPAIMMLAQINGQIAVGGIDRRPRESLEAWLARRRKELAALGPPAESVKPAPLPPLPPSGEPPRTRATEHPGSGARPSKTSEQE